MSRQTLSAVLELPEEPGHREACAPPPGVLVLNHNYEPLNICTLRRGLVLVYLQKVEVIRRSSYSFISVDDQFLLPSVIRVKSMIKRPQPKLRVSRKSVLARDGYCCQYCGSGKELTLDHVFPRHRGGETTWENLVCCCRRCNGKKGSHTPSEAGMRLPHLPRKPGYVPYIPFPRFVAALKNPDWHDFLAGYGKGLE